MEGEAAADGNCDVPAAPVDAARVSGVEGVEYVGRNVCEGCDIAAAAGQRHEARRFKL